MKIKFENWTKYKLQCRQELFEQIIPFWEKYSLDETYGGYFTCLDREGKVYDTDKFIWLQCRQVWTFSMLYNRYNKNDNWLHLAEKGADFLQKYGTDKHGNWYFSLDRKGNPLIQPYNIFSDCFAAMAFAQLGLASGKEEYNDLAISTFRNIIHRQENPKGIYNKSFPGTRPLKNFALPMIICNLALELKHLLPRDEVENLLDKMVKEVLKDFFDADSGLILENVTPEGNKVDTFEGRLLNPGHGIEAMWFIMDIAERWQDDTLFKRCARTVIRILDHAWDQEHQGIFYFMDIKNKPVQQLEWDQKLWWVHLETLVALAKAFSKLQTQEYSDWFHKVHQYTWSHFPDPEFGEWYGYLNRRGEVSIPLKGGKWKGCFHVPRALFQIYQTL